MSNILDSIEDARTSHGIRWHGYTTYDRKLSRNIHFRSRCRGIRAHTEVDKKLILDNLTFTSTSSVIRFA